MGNIFQNLRVYSRGLNVEENRTAIIVILSVFSFSHVAIVSWAIELLDTEEVISLLYTLIMVMILYVTDWLVRQPPIKGNIPLKTKSPCVLRAVREPTDLTETESSNMYIDRWKKLNLYRTPEFPMERLAFLNSTMYDCVGKHFFFLRNSQVKQLSVRKLSQNRCDDVCHPKKLVTDLFGSYMHRRSLFYRNRNVCAASKRQFTKSIYHPSRSEEFDSLTYSTLYGKEDKKKFEKMLEPDDVSSEKSSEGKGPKKYLKSMKKAMGSAVEGLMPKSMSRPKESEK